MTTNTILTDDEILDLGLFHHVTGPYSFARAIEQAVLQSPEVQAWKKDAEAFRLMVPRRLTVKVDELCADVEVFHLGECLAWPPSHQCENDTELAAVTRDAIHSAVAAMEKQP